MHCCTFNRFIY